MWRCNWDPSSGTKSGLFYKVTYVGNMKNVCEKLYKKNQRLDTAKVEKYKAESFVVNFVLQNARRILSFLLKENTRMLTLTLLGH